jgi:DDE superfamily endonuclease
MESAPLMDISRYHIIGDSGFPLKNWLLVPYKRTSAGLNRSHLKFNRKLSGTRSVVERAFGDLKTRFRRCLNIDAKVENAVNIIATSVCIHNLCIENGDFCRDSVSLNEEGNHQQVCSEEQSVSGTLKREAIRAQLNRNGQ